MAYRMSALADLGEREIARFREDGFLIVPNFLSEEQVETLRASFPKLFAGQLDTGVYPDEWYWLFSRSAPGGKPVPKASQWQAPPLCRTMGFQQSGHHTPVRPQQSISLSYNPVPSISCIPIPLHRHDIISHMASLDPDRRAVRLGVGDFALEKIKNVTGTAFRGA